MTRNGTGPRGELAANCLNRYKDTAPLRGVKDFYCFNFLFDLLKASEHVEYSGIYPVSRVSSSVYSRGLDLRASGPFNTYFTSQTSRQLGKKQLNKINLGSF